MDRNEQLALKTMKNTDVALRKESVDRNKDMSRADAVAICVALRKESVDRNMISSLKKIFAEPSLSARRAWIEISKSGLHPLMASCRSPQGERG